MQRLETVQKKLVTRHVLYPIAATAVFFAIVRLPVEVLGCRLRGLIAVAVALIAGIAGIFAALIAVKGKIQGDADSLLWMASALIFAVPLVYIAIIAA